MSQPAQEFDAGLVVVHGVGRHAKGAFFTRAVGPFLGRMRAEGALRSVRSLSFPAGVDGAGSLEALDVRYAAAPDSAEKRLLMVEGRWADAYERAGPPQIAAWVFRHELPMLWRVLIYFCRDWMWLGAAVLALGFLVAALFAVVATDGDPAWPAALLGASLICALTLAAWNFQWRTVPLRTRIGGLAGAVAVFALISGGAYAALWLAWSRPYGWGGAAAGAAGLVAGGALLTWVSCAWERFAWTALGFRLVPLAAFSYQRGVVIIVVAIGMVVLPALTALLRIVASIPGVGLLGLKGLQRIEETLFIGSNFGDMHAFADSPARFARIASAVEHALRQVEDRVKPGGTVTVLAHSGGALVSWVLLTEPFAAQRRPSLRYRVITAGAALNWAQHGFDEPDLPPITGRFVNQAGPNQTLGAHIYGTWDSVPHGPFRPQGNQPAAIVPDRFNIAARNLGDPSLAEHGEYWNNQEDVVPVIGRAIDDSMPWVAEATATGAAWDVRANARLGVVAVLTRVRVALFLAPVLALVLLLAAPVVPNSDDRTRSGDDTTAATGNINLLYRAADQYGESLGACFTVSKEAEGGREPISRDEYYEACDLPGPAEATIWYGFRHAFAGNAVFVVVLWLVALGLLDAYRDLFWRIGGRTDASLTHPKFGIATSPRTQALRFTGTLLGLAVIPALLWLVPVLAIHATAPVDRMVYALGFAVSAAIAFAEWTYVRSLVLAAREAGVRRAIPAPMAPLYEVLGRPVGRARR